MDDLKDMIDNIFEIENIDENYFKSFKIDSDNIIYFIFHENQKFMKGKIISCSIDPIGFILKNSGEYTYCPFDEKELDENLIEEFVKRIIFKFDLK